MSRIGRNPVAITDGVDVSTTDTSITVKGPKGELTQKFPAGITAVVEDGRVVVSRADDTKHSKSVHGLTRSLVQGMVEGVTKGFEKRLEVVGVSYQASLDGKRLKLMVGFSHPVYVDIPSSLNVTCPSTVQIQVAGCDKQMVGEFAARVRRVRPPEPYKGKGIRYLGEQVVQKAGKSFVGGEK